MHRLVTLLQRGASGVYWARDPAVARAPLAGVAARRGQVLHVVDCDGARDVETFLRRAAAALRFPARSGGSWEHFEACLGDLSWLGPGGLVVHFEAVDALAEACPEAFAKAVAALRAVAAERAADGAQRLFLLSGARPPPGVPEVA